MIEALKYGQITVNGKTYDHDIFILPNGELKRWKRSEETVLSLSDLDEIFKSTAKRIILGNGMYRMLSVLPNTRSAIKGKGFTLDILQSKQAVDEYNALKDTAGIAFAIHIRD